MTRSTSGPGQWRPDIQALRALAVVLVVVYHLWPGRLTGGFVGVDVFFVVSGYLIGGHLLGELQRTGRVRPLRFWARRARRLVPASGLVLVVVALVTVTLGPLSSRADVLHQVAGAALDVENWVLAHQAVDYLASAQSPSPVQHFWSLSVEEQLYVVLPLVLLAVGRLAPARHRRAGAVGVLVVLLMASLAWSAVSTAADPAVAYLSTLTRAWEFLAGALLTVLPQVGGPRTRAALGVAGLALVVGSAVRLDGARAFPGVLALLPVVGAVLLMAARDRGPLAWAARFRPVTWLGDVSYAVYLWHWPLIVLLPTLTGRPLGLGGRVGVLVATLALATLSTYVVEQPLRTRPRLRTGRGGRQVVLGLAVGTLVLAATATVGARVARGEQERKLASAEQGLSGAELRCLGAAARDLRVRGCHLPADLLVPPPSAVTLDDDNRAACWTGFGDASLHLCHLGPRRPGGLRVLAVGDSHSNVYLAAYEALAARHGWSLDVAGRAGCSWSLADQGGRTPAIEAECDHWKQELAAHLAATPAYDVILTTADQSGYPAVPAAGQSAHAATVAGLHAAWAAQVARGTTVVALDDYPVAIREVVSCVERYAVGAATRCARSRAAAVPAVDPLAEAVAETPGTALVGLRDLLCSPTTCWPVVGHVVAYRNRDHLSATFVRTLAPYLDRRLAAAERRAKAAS